MKVQDRIEEIIIDSDLYQTFIGEHADYSFMEKKLATAILKECIHVSELPKEKELNYEDEYEDCDVLYGNGFNDCLSKIKKLKSK